MKDKRQRMALTWPYANPHLAAYMFAAAATAAAYGQPAAMYWNRAAAAAAAAATAPSPPYPAPAQPYHHLMGRPNAATPGETAYINTAHMPDSSALMESISRHGATSTCCPSPICHGCPSTPNSSPIPHSPSSMTSYKQMNSSSPEMGNKKLFQPYKNDLDK